MNVESFNAHTAWVRERLTRRGIDPHTQTQATVALVEEAIDTLSEPLDLAGRAVRVRGRKRRVPRQFRTRRC